MLSLSILIDFPNFRLICSYFVLVTIITFDFALQICIYVTHTEYFWVVMAGLKETFCTLILKFLYVTIYLLAKPQTMLQLKILMAQTLFHYKVFSDVVHFIRSLLIHRSIDLISFSPLKIF